MSVLNIEGVTHWSIPVNDLAEAEAFYGELLGLTPKGRLGNNTMSCFNVGDHNILLCERSPLRPMGARGTTVGRITRSRCRRRPSRRRAGSLRGGDQDRPPDLPGTGVLHRTRTVLLRPQRQPAGAPGPHLDGGDAGAVVR